MEAKRYLNELIKFILWNITRIAFQLSAQFYTSGYGGYSHPNQKQIEAIRTNHNQSYNIPKERRVFYLHTDIRELFPTAQMC